MGEYKFGDNLNIKVIGVGNLGSNCLERLKPLDKRGITRIAIGLPSKGLTHADAHKKIILDSDKRFVSEDEMGEELAKRLFKKYGQDINKHLVGADIVFIVGGLGREVNFLLMEHIALLARDMGVVSFGIATKPFSFEGKKRQDLANAFADNLKQSIDSLLVIPSDKLVRDGLSANKALTMADKTVGDCIEALLEIVFTVGNINIDFNDFKATIERSGAAFLGLAEGECDKLEPVLKEVTNNHYFELPFQGAKRVLYLVSASQDLTLDELRQVGDYLASRSDVEARIIFGLAVDNKLKSRIRLTVLGCGIEDTYPREQSTISESASEMVKPQPEKAKDTNEEKNEYDIPAFLRKKMDKEE